MRKLWRGAAGRPSAPETDLDQVDTSPQEESPIADPLPAAPVPPEEPMPDVAMATGIATEPEEAAEREGRPGRWQRFKRPVMALVPHPDLRWNQRTVTVSLEKDMVQVVVFKGRRVVAWDTADLSSDGAGAGAEGEDGAPVEVEDDPASRLQNSLARVGMKRGGRWSRMVDRIGIRRGRVVMDLSLYTTLMRHLLIPRVRVRYLEPVVVSEVLESLPFSKEEVDIAWQLQKAEEGQGVFAIALPKERVDHQVRLVREAGLIPAAAYSKASALALASGVANGIVVHQAATETSLVLVHGGDPKVVHQLEFGGGGSASEEHAASLVRAIEQVAGYFQPNDPSEQGQGPTLPVILTGLFSPSDPVTQSLLRRLRRRVLSVAPPVRCPGDFPAGEYATNLGLFQADRMGNTRKAADSSSPVARPLNLLPRRHRPRPVPVFQAAIFVILILLAVHPYNLTGQVDAMVQEKDILAREHRELQLQERSHDILLANYRESNRQLESVRTQTASLEAHLEQLQEDMDTLLARLYTITNEALAPSVQLSSVAPLGRDYSVVGTAASHGEVLQYAANLRSSPLFSEARIVRVDGAGGANPDNLGRVGFQIRVTLPAAASSEPAR